MNSHTLLVHITHTHHPSSPPAHTHARTCPHICLSPSPTRTRTWTRTRHHLSRPPKETPIFSIPDEYAVPCCRLLLHRCCGIHDGWCRGSQCYRWGCCLGFCEGNTSISSPPPFRSFPTNFRPYAWSSAGIRAQCHLPDHHPLPIPLNSHCVFLTGARILLPLYEGTTTGGNDWPRRLR